MSFTLKFTEQAELDLRSPEEDKSLFKRLKTARKALGYLETNLRHPGLNTHKYSALARTFSKEGHKLSRETIPMGKEASIAFLAMVGRTVPGEPIVHPDFLE